MAFIASIVREKSSSSSQPQSSAPLRMTSRSQPAAKRLSLNFFLSDLTSKSMTDLLGRMITAAPMSPVSSSTAKRTFSMGSSGAGRSGLLSELWDCTARTSASLPPAARSHSAA